MKHIIQWISIVGTALLSCGCSASDDALGSALAPAPERAVLAQPMNGQVMLGTACQPHAAMIQEAFARARQQVEGGSLRHCLVNAFVSLDLPFNTLSHSGNWAARITPEVLVNALAADTATEVDCVEANYHGEAGINTGDLELINLGLPYLRSSQTTVAALASTILHELTHNKGAMHDAYGITGSEYSFSLPVQVANCSKSISDGQYVGDLAFHSAAPGNAPRTSHSSVFLAPQGNGWHTRYDVQQCFPSEYVGGFMVDYTDSELRGITPRCHSYATASYMRPLGRMGATGAQSQIVQCPAGHQVVGVTADFAPKVGLYSMALSCANANDTRNFQQWSSVPAFPVIPSGWTHLLKASRACPGGSGIVGLKGMHSPSSGVRSVEWLCGEKNWRFAPSISIGSVGSTPTGNFGEDTRLCPPDSLMTGLIGHSGWYLHRLGGTCSRLNRTDDSLSEQKSLLASWGGYQESQNAFGVAMTSFREECPLGSALVGLTARAGIVVDAVQGICANVHYWRHKMRHEVTTTGMCGGTGGSLKPLQCEFGKFLTGWLISTQTYDWDVFHGFVVRDIAPVCSTLPRDSYADYPITFDDGSDYRYLEVPGATNGDWAAGYYKAGCFADDAMVGLSANISRNAAHSALCRNNGRLEYQNGVVLDFQAGDNRRSANTGDWDIGTHKGECGSAEVVTGIAQTTDHRLAKILCTPLGPQYISGACVAKKIWFSDNWPGGSDWAWGYYKGQCDAGQLIKGVSKVTSTGQVSSILCCPVKSG